MSTTDGISKGGRPKTGGEQKKRNILLVGSHASDADAIRRELGIATGHDYTTWYCSDCEESLDFIKLKHFSIDIIFLDLSLFSVNYPKEYFMQMKANIPDIPIIVLTDRTDYDLMAFVMEEGAADNVSQWQLRSDPDRLRNIIESCIARDKISKKTTLQSETDLVEAQDKSDIILFQTHERAAINLKLVEDENTRLRNDRVLDEAGLKDAKDASDSALKQSQDDCASELKNANDDNSQLREDNDKLSASLEISRDQGITDLKEAYDRHDADMLKEQGVSAAILKYAQDKNAVDLKKMKDENKTLRNYNDYAREWLSGNYASSSPEKGEPASEQNDEDKLLN